MVYSFKTTFEVTNETIMVQADHCNGGMCAHHYDIVAVCNSKTETGVKTRCKLKK